MHQRLPLPKDSHSTCRPAGTGALRHPHADSEAPLFTVAMETRRHSPASGEPKVLGLRAGPVFPGRETAQEASWLLKMELCSIPDLSLNPMHRLSTQAQGESLISLCLSFLF
jgi:hypothetical protein